jgi:AcrR family transcriptional regulator
VTVIDRPDVTAPDAPEVLLWRPPTVPNRGPRRGLTLDEIARAAVDVADGHGLAALSMQRVASELDVTKMALYRYVSGKPQLEALMIDAAVEDPPRRDALPDGWRAAAEAFAGLVSDVWTRHPWLPWVTVGDRLMGPREVGWVEVAMRLFEPTGLTPAERMDAVTLLFGHLRTRHATASAGTRPWTTGPDHTTTLRGLLTEKAADFPALLAAMSAGDRTAEEPSPARAAFGLQCLLDGLEVAADRRARVPGPADVPAPGTVSRPPAG